MSQFDSANTETDASADCEFKSVAWGACIAFESYGVRAAVRVDDESLVGRVIERLPYRSSTVELRGSLPQFSFVTAQTGVSGYRVYDPSGETAEAETLDDSLHLLASHLQIYVGEMVKDLVFLHAGVVGWRGRAIVLPGRSYAGKTTLVRELVRAGALYYSDEYAVLDGGGLVHPFARPLSIRGSTWRQTPHPVETLGGVAGTEPIPVGLVLLSQYQPRARWRTECLSPGRALLELLNHAIPARREPAHVLETLGKVAESAPVLRVMRGDARRVATRILSLIEA